VHFATLRGGRDAGREVAVKVLRPNMLPAIEKDRAFMRTMAGGLERLAADGRRLRRPIGLGRQIGDAVELP